MASITSNGRAVKAPEILADALKQHHNNHLISYPRVSGRRQVAIGALEKQEQLLGEVIEKAGGVLIDSFPTDELGYLNANRSELVKAVEATRRCDGILVATFADRFVRPREFHPQDNWEAQATPQEWARFFRGARGIVVATAFPPDLTAREIKAIQQSLDRTPKEERRQATIEGMQAAIAQGRFSGRPAKIEKDPELLGEILYLYQYGDGTDLDSWPPSYRWIAKKLEMKSHGLVQRALNRPAPECHGVTWRELAGCNDVYKYWVEVYRNGSAP